jgi:MFS family permease
VPNYRLWFGAALVANVGTWMQRIGQDWLVLTMLTNNSGAAMGIVTALQFLPFILLSPYAGILADRLPRRRLLMATQSASGLLALILGVMTLSGVVALWHVYVLAGLLGMVTAIDTPVRQAFVGNLVGADLLPNAVGLNSASFNAARMIGPGISGLLIALVGPGIVFLINGASFAATVAALAFMSVSKLVPQPVMDRNVKTTRQLRQAFTYLKHRPDALLIMVLMSLVSLFAFNFQIVNALMARVEFGKGAAEFGIVGSVMGIGSLAGALLAARREHPRVLTVIQAGLGLAAALAFAAIMPNYITYIIATIPLGFTSLTMMTAANATLQIGTPPELRGRVMALYMMFFQGVTPIGAMLLGWIGEHYEPRMSLVIGSVGVAAACTAAVLWTNHRYSGRFALRELLLRHA